MNTSVDADDNWWRDYNYERKGSPMNTFIYWIERNEFWLEVAVVGTLVAAVWIITAFKVFPGEIRDLYSTSKANLIGKFASLRNFIIRGKNRRQTRCYYYRTKIRDKESEEIEVRLELDGRRKRPSKQTVQKTINPQTQQERNMSNRRTRIRIIDDIYGEIVGYQDSAGPSFQGKENPVVLEQKISAERIRTNQVIHKNKTGELESKGCQGVQPKCHVKESNLKTVMEETSYPRLLSVRPGTSTDVTNRVRPMARPAQSTRRSRISPHNSHVTPEMIRMREITCRMKREREEATKAGGACFMEDRYQDLVETRV